MHNNAWFVCTLLTGLSCLTCANKIGSLRSLSKQAQTTTIRASCLPNTARCSLPS